MKSAADSSGNFELRPVSQKPTFGQSTSTCIKLWTICISFILTSYIKTSK